MHREYTQNRELSWLKFNERVLEEAADETVPLLERLKFVSIFTSNLDEFFMIRVGSLSELMHLKESPVDKKSGMNAEEQLKAIYAEVGRLYEKRERTYDDLEKQLRLHGICNLSYRELENEEKKYLKKFFHEYIAPVLSPQIVDQHHPFPHLQNKTVHVAARLSHKNKEVFAFIPVPAILPPIIYLKENDVRYIRIEEIISAWLDEIFENYTIKEKVSMCITRNADINADDEAFDFGYDFRRKMKRVLKQRRRLGAVRLELSGPVSREFLIYLTEHIGVREEQVFFTTIPFRLDYAFDLAGQLTEDKARALTYRPFVPQDNPSIDLSRSIFEQVERKDVVLSLPFESLQPFLQLLKEASESPSVVSIKITIYRLASQAKVVEYLCAAAENGKDVTVLIELRARFDEQNNIDWSERLEDAGCTVIYGFESYKVHSKVCLITRRERGAIRYITQIGTGNYNEKTAKQYTDLSLITADQSIGRDAAEFFKNLAIGNPDGKYEQLLVSPHLLKKAVIEFIDEEIEKGSEGSVTLKLNSVTDLDIIEKLKQASCAGVQIRMIVRGICCILPGIEGKTDNIMIKSIVGRFLEHSRIYCFGKGEAEKMFISSADFMTRNTERRVEVACPVLDREAREKIRNILQLCFSDNVKGRVLQPDGTYAKAARGEDEKKTDAQLSLMQQAVKAAEQPVYGEEKSQTGGLAGFLRRLASKAGGI
ncbi:MAG: polyphosphate kinase 1 [Emergencia sp.]